MLGAPARQAGQTWSNQIKLKYFRVLGFDSGFKSLTSID
jgi:hypothetical protein